MDENIVNKLQLPSGGGNITTFKNLNYFGQLQYGITEGVSSISIPGLGSFNTIQNLDFSKVQVSCFVEMRNDTNKTIRFSLDQSIIPEYKLLESTGLPQGSLFTSYSSISIIDMVWEPEFEGASTGTYKTAWAILPVNLYYSYGEGTLVLQFPEELQNLQGETINITQYTSFSASARLEFI